MGKIFRIEILCFLLWELLNVPATPIARWHQTMQESQQEIQIFEETATSLSSMLERLSSQFHTPVGFEAYPESGRGQSANISIKVESGTIYDVLDAIIRSDPRYTWVKSDGMVDVFPKDVRNPILDVIVANFGVSQIDKDSAIQLITELPEIKAKIEGGGCVEGILRAFHLTPLKPTHFGSRCNCRMCHYG